MEKEKENAGIRPLDERGEQVEIDLLELLGVFLDNAHFIVLCALAGALVLNAYSYFGIHPTYEATSKLYIVSASKDSVVDITDLNLGTSLTADYEELIMSYPVLDQVMERAEEQAGVSYEGVDATEFAKCISLENPQNTRLLDITVKTTDPALSTVIANAVAEVAREYLPKTMSISRPNIAQVARVPDHKAGPSYARFTLAGAAIGLIAMCGLLTVLYATDDSLRTGEDMEREFGVAPLASVPESPVFAAVDAADDAVVSTEERKKGRKGGRRR